MRSTVLTRASAIVLALAGLVLLFAPAEILARTSPEAPASVAWIAQLLGAAWLGLAAMNWIARFTMVGGIFGRPIVLANTMVYVVSAMTLLHVVRGMTPTGVMAATAVALVMALAYGYLLLRGPFAADRTPVVER